MIADGHRALANHGLNLNLEKRVAQANPARRRPAGSCGPGAVHPDSSGRDWLQGARDNVHVDWPYVCRGARANQRCMGNVSSIVANLGEEGRQYKEKAPDIRYVRHTEAALVQLVLNPDGCGEAIIEIDST